MLEQHLARVRGEALVRRRFRGGPGPSEAGGEVRRVGRGNVCAGEKAVRLRLWPVFLRSPSTCHYRAPCVRSMPCQCLVCLYSGHSSESAHLDACPRSKQKAEWKPHLYFPCWVHMGCRALHIGWELGNSANGSGRSNPLYSWYRFMPRLGCLKPRHQARRIPPPASLTCFAPRAAKRTGSRSISKDQRYRD